MLIFQMIFIIEKEINKVEKKALSIILVNTLFFLNIAGIYYL